MCKIVIRVSTTYVCFLIRKMLYRSISQPATRPRRWLGRSTESPDDKGTHTLSLKEELLATERAIKSSSGFHSTDGTEGASGLRAFPIAAPLRH